MYDYDMKGFYEMFPDEEMIEDMRDAFREEGIRIGIEEGIRIRREEARKEAREEGRKQGREESSRRIALEMLKRGFSIQEIASITNLTVETIEKMRTDATLRSWTPKTVRGEKASAVPHLGDCFSSAEQSIPWRDHNRSFCRTIRQGPVRAAIPVRSPNPKRAARTRDHLRRV